MRIQLFPKTVDDLRKLSYVDWTSCVEQFRDLYHKDFLAIVPCGDSNSHRLIIGTYCIDEKGRSSSELYIRQSEIVTTPDVIEISEIIKTRIGKEEPVAYKKTTLDFGFDTNPYGVDSFYFDFIPRYPDGHAKVGSSRMPINRKTLAKIDKMFSSYLKGTAN